MSGGDACDKNEYESDNDDDEETKGKDQDDSETYSLATGKRYPAEATQARSCSFCAWLVVFVASRYNWG